MNENRNRGRYAQKNKRRKGRLILCAVYLAVFVIFFLCLCAGLQWLENWLTDYEAAQPNVKAQQVFEELFRDPDWAALYALAGVEDTAYESASHYAAYMEQTVGDAALTYYETSAGLSGDHKYIVKLSDQKIAEYTLSASEHTVTDIPDWQLRAVTLAIDRQRSVTVCAPPDATVYVNGVALGQDRIVATMDTAAEDYLPEDIQGLRRCWWYVGELLHTPEVTALSGSGETLKLVCEEATGTYTAPIPEQTISQEQQALAMEAAQTYCLYMIGAVHSAHLRACFDSDSEIYQIITRNQTFMQEYKGYYFGEHTISGFYNYSDSLFSVRVTLPMYVRRLSGEDKEYPLDSTFLFQKQDDGVWRVINMINEDLQEQTVLVRLRYLADGVTVEEQMVATTAMTLTPPQVTAPEGKVFAGWYRQEKAANGSTTYSLAFAPDESGSIRLSEPLGWNPMELYALFEDPA